MPRADLRSKDDALDRLALVKLLAVMCYPADARSREGMLKHGSATIAVLRHHSIPRREPASLSAVFWSEFAVHRRRGCLAGAFCLALAQLGAMSRHGELTVALRLAGALASEWEKAISSETAIGTGAWVPPRSESEMTNAFEQYRSVAHLWAAIVYGKIRSREDISPPSFQAIPTFLAYASEIARLSVALPWSAREEGLAITAESLWTFILPSALVRKAEAEISPTQSGFGRQQPQFGNNKHLDG